MRIPFIVVVRLRVSCFTVTPPLPRQDGSRAATPPLRVGTAGSPYSFVHRIRLPAEGCKVSHTATSFMRSRHRGPPTVSRRTAPATQCCRGRRRWRHSASSKSSVLRSRRSPPSADSARALVPSCVSCSARRLLAARTMSHVMIASKSSRNGNRHARQRPRETPLDRCGHAEAARRARDADDLDAVVEGVGHGEPITSRGRSQRSPGRRTVRPLRPTSPYLPTNSPSSPRRPQACSRTCR